MADQENTTRINCGDTTWCDDCETNEKATTSFGAKTSSVPTQEKNALGRCDFYSGPKREVRHIRSR